MCFGINQLSNFLITKYSEYEHYVRYSIEAESVLNKAIFYNLLTSILMSLEFLTLRYLQMDKDIKPTELRILYNISVNILILAVVDAFLP